MHPDYKYIQALLNNDFQMVEEIYRRFAGRIAQFVCANQGNSADAEDVFQDSLLLITRQAERPGFMLTCPFEAYLYMVCRGRWLNELKRRKRSVVTFVPIEGFTEEAAAPMGEKLLQEEARDQLFQSALAEISAACRQIIQLAWTGIGMEAVAQQLGFSYAYARKRKAECIAILIERVKKSPEYQSLT
jgi:RNA polymerase sigma factor (sigma-70 family)